MNRINYELKKVENGPIGKLFRTLGYLLILVAAGYFALSNLAIFDVSYINQIVDPALDFFNEELKVFADYWQLILVSGIFMLIWPLSKKKALPTITTILLLLVVFVDNQLYGKGSIIPFLNVPEIKYITDTFSKFNWLELVVYLIPLLFVYILIGLKKPKRIAASLLSGGLLVLMFALIGNSLPTILNNNWATNDIFIQVIAGVFSLSFILQALAGLFGVLGFMRK